MTVDKHWTVDKKVPVALIVVIFLQTIGLVGYIFRLDARVENVERYVASASPPQGDRLTRVETKIENVERGVEEIKRLLRRNNGADR